MCIILTSDMQPKSTRLFTVEVQPIVPAKGLKRPRAHLVVYDNDVDIKGARFAEKRQLMVVPFPNSDRLPAELVVFPDRQAEEALFELADKLVPRTSWTNSSLGATRSMRDTADSDTMITVQQVGGYKASVALDYSELTGRIKWDQFQLPIHFDDLLRDLRERFGKGFGFIVAEPNRAQNGQFGGAFAWVYHSSEPCLPTAHEKSSRATVHYNVKGYVFSDGRTRVTWGNNSKDYMDISTKSNLDEEMLSHLTALLKTVRFARKTSGTKSVPLQLIAAPLTFGLRVDINGSVPVNDHVYIKRARTVRFDLDKNIEHTASMASVAALSTATATAARSSNPINYAFIFAFIVGFIIAFVLTMMHRKRIYKCIFSLLGTKQSTVDNV